MEINIDKALKDPAGVFKEPKNVLKSSLSKEEKIRVLKQWEYDARTLLVAEEENMPGGEDGMLNRILEALHQLGVQYDEEKSSSPTKQGGGNG